MSETSRSDRYYALFTESREVDWRRLAGDDPECRREIEVLGMLDRIRAAYRATGDGDATRTVAWDGSAPRPAARPDDGPPVPPCVRGYRILGIVGQGGFATIYRAEDEKTGREVALKVLKPGLDLSSDITARFLREARALARLENPNIVRIYHVIDENGKLGLSMELIAGETLEQVLKKAGRLEPRAAARIGADLAAALDVVHEAGFIHRDIKCENVMREKGGRIVLMDFGISRSIDPTTRVTATGVLVGTPVAMAPEQYEFQEADRRTDVYSLGCLLYRLLAGRHAITGDTVGEIRSRVLEADYPPLEELRPDVPADLAAIVKRAMRREPKRRYESARDMRDALRGWLHRECGEGEAPPPRRQPFPTAVVVLLGAILAVLAGILAMLIRQAMGD
ncbi:MAG: serine/threonine protein kinase [Planctomycetes bacterium]|nr:serine/threonine protein kinase [Planctomycetota bacterium]